MTCAMADIDSTHGAWCEMSSVAGGSLTTDLAEPLDRREPVSRLVVLLGEEATGGIFFYFFNDGTRFGART